MEGKRKRRKGRKIGRKNLRLNEKGGWRLETGRKIKKIRL